MRRETAARSKARGMTLIEVLVALLVLSIALMAAVRATGVTVENASALRARVCAEWVGQNQLELHRARRDWLSSIPEKPVAVQQCNIDFIYTEQVSNTPSPLARRVDVHVQLASSPGHDVAVTSGYLMNQGSDSMGAP